MNLSPSPLIYGILSGDIHFCKLSIRKSVTSKFRTQLKALHDTYTNQLMQHDTRFSWKMVQLCRVLLNKSHRQILRSDEGRHKRR